MAEKFLGAYFAIEATDPSPSVASCDLPSRLQSEKPLWNWRMKSYPQYEEALGVMSRPHRLTQRTGQRMENLGLGRVRKGAALWCSLHSPWQGGSPGGWQRAGSESCLPHKSALGVGETLDISSPYCRTLGGSRFLECTSPAARRQLAVLAPYMPGEVRGRHATEDVA